MSDRTPYPGSFRFLPSVAGILGAIVGYILASWGLGFWEALHSAVARYLSVATFLGSIAAPVTALFAYWALRIATKKKGHEITTPRKWTHRMVGIWLALAPAGHWMASSALFLYASRYSPPGGKMVPIAFGLIHIFLLALCISGAVFRIRGDTNLNRILKVYFVALTVCVAAQVAANWTYGPVLPLLYWGVIVVTIATIWSAIQFFTGQKSGNVPNSNQVPNSSAGELAKTEQKGVWIAEATGFILGALFMLVYFLTSQFDTRPTGPLTHSLLLVLSVAYLTAALFFEKRRVVAQLLLRFVGPILLTVELLILVLLHHNDETDPIRIVTVATIPAILLSAYAALSQRSGCPQ